MYTLSIYVRYINHEKFEKGLPFTFKGEEVGMVTDITSYDSDWHYITVSVNSLADCEEIRAAFDFTPNCSMGSSCNV